MKLSKAPLLVLRLGLGAAVLVAGGAKLPDPATFAAAIESFQIVPGALVASTALALPFFEILLGIMLLTGWQRRCAAFSATLLFGLYLTALALGLARDLPLECDCFGSSVPAWLALLRDMVLLTGGAAVYCSEAIKDAAAHRSSNKVSS